MKQYLYSEEHYQEEIQQYYDNLDKNKKQQEVIDYYFPMKELNFPTLGEDYVRSGDDILKVIAIDIYNRVFLEDVYKRLTHYPLEKFNDIFVKYKK